MRKSETFRLGEAIEPAVPFGPIVDFDLYVNTDGETDELITTFNPDGSIEQEGLDRFIETAKTAVEDLKSKAKPQS